MAYDYCFYSVIISKSYGQCVKLKYQLHLIKFYRNIWKVSCFQRKFIVSLLPRVAQSASQDHKAFCITWEGSAECKASALQFILRWLPSVGFKWKFRVSQTYSHLNILHLMLYKTYFVYTNAVVSVLYCKSTFISMVSTTLLCVLRGQWLLIAACYQLECFPEVSWFAHSVTVT